VYRTTYRIATALAHTLPLPSGTVRDSVTARHAALGRWREWGRNRPGGEPLVWVHGASVGELTTAEPVITRLVRDRPRLQVVATYSSPSATNWQLASGFTHVDFVPADRPRDVAATLDALRPSLLVFSRGDVWPELVRGAAARRIPVAIMAGTVRPASGRLRWPVRSLYARVLNTVSWLGAVSEADAERWMRLGVPAGRIVVTGDPRHDAVLDRVPEPRRLTPLEDWRGGDPTLVAGSVEPGDRPVLLEAARTVLHANSDARLILVPHEPDTAAVAGWRHAVQTAGLAVGVWTPAHRAPRSVRIVLVAARGLLADLYSIGALAYVGGGFRRRGLHAVAEPAAWAVPVIVGPQWRDAADAATLLQAGGAVGLPRRGAGAALVGAWSSWLADAEARIRAGLSARQTLSRGAARHTADTLGGLLGGSLGPWSARGGVVGGPRSGGQ
jgi:3-deoxy-D-manno-octulosonic-acid transferase